MLAEKAELERVRSDGEHAVLKAQIDSYERRVDAQDAMISVQSGHISDVIGIVGISLAVVTALLSLVGLIGYFRVKGDAKEEAVKVAEEEVVKWFSRRATDVNEEFSDLKRRMQLLEEAAKDFAEAHRLKVEQYASSAIEAIKRSMEDGIDGNLRESRSPDGKNVTLDESIALSESARVAEKKDAVARSFSDWRTLAFAAVGAKNLDLAIEYWSSALSTSRLTEYERAFSMYNLALAQGARRNRTAARSVYEEMIRVFSDSDEISIKKLVARSRANLAGEISMLGDPLEARRIYEQLIVQFQDSEHVELREVAARALFNMGRMLGRNGDVSAEIECYKKVIARFEDEDDGEIRDDVARAMCNLNVVYLEMKRFDDVISLADKIIYKFIRDDGAFKNYVAKAFVCKANALDDMEKWDAADVAYESAVEILRGESSVGQPLIGRGFMRVKRAKKEWGDSSRRVELLNQAAALFDEANKASPGDGITLGNIAYVSHLMGEEASVVEGLLERALRVGGQELYDVTLDDIGLHHVAEKDVAFKYLLDGVWEEISSD